MSRVNCGSSNWGQGFTYDPFGNITKSGSNGGTSFSPSYSTTTNRITTTGYTYDANGNLLTDNGTHTYTWDAEGKLASLDGNSVERGKGKGDVLGGRGRPDVSLGKGKGGKGTS